MWDEENDKRMRDAANHFQPPFDEAAWQKMEQLLDENLPQKKDRKRFLFLLPFVLMLAGFVFFVFFYHNNHSSTQRHFHENPVTKNNPSVENPHNENITAKVIERNKKKAIATTGNDSKERKTKLVEENGNAVNNVVKKGNQNKIFDGNIAQNEPEKATLNPGKNYADSKPTNSSKSDFTEKDDKMSSTSKAETKQQTLGENVSQIKDETTKAKRDEKSVKQQPEKKKNFANDFSLSFSAGPGVSAVGNNEGKLTLDFGIGAAYRFSKHFGVRAGVLVSKKIYSATPEQYNPGIGNYTYLEKINANCNVIDIPLNIDYYFKQKGKHGWFISTGLSSYLMKKESYDYVYKTPGGQVYNKDWTIKNQNKHFFSVLNLSAGYQYSLNKRFSLVVQPYIDLPLTGIGAGKVKLNSGGILFTVKAKPFLKKTN